MERTDASEEDGALDGALDEGIFEWPRPGMKPGSLNEGCAACTEWLHCKLRAMTTSAPIARPCEAVRLGDEDSVQHRRMERFADPTVKDCLLTGEENPFLLWDDRE